MDKHGRKYAKATWFVVSDETIFKNQKLAISYQFFFANFFFKITFFASQNAWFRRRPGIQAVTQQDDLPRSRELGWS